MTNPMLDRAHILSYEIHALEQETAFLKATANETAEEARAALDKAERYRDAFRESKRELALAQELRTGEYLKQAKRGLEYQEDLVQKYRDMLGGEEDAPIPDPTPPGIIDVDLGSDVRILQGRRCTPPGSYLLSNTRAPSMAECLLKCDPDGGDTRRCTHVSYNDQTQVCAVYAKGDLDVIDAGACRAAPNVDTAIAPGVPCVGCE
jgi:hypothetical protein